MEYGIIIMNNCRYYKQEERYFGGFRENNIFRSFYQRETRNVLTIYMPQHQTYQTELWICSHQ